MYSIVSLNFSAAAHGNALPLDPRIDQFIRKMEVPGSYNGYQPTEDYSMTG